MTRQGHLGADPLLMYSGEAVPAAQPWASNSQLSLFTSYPTVLLCPRVVYAMYGKKNDYYKPALVWSF